jgi:pyruvate formate lyase activating enzyme
LPNLISSPLIKEAMYYEKIDYKNVQCNLCPRNCFIKNGKRGFCGISENRDGILFSLSYA